MTRFRPPVPYFCGVLVGFGLGIFVVAVLAEDGTFPANGAAWKVTKFLGLAMIIAGGVWLMRLGKGLKQVNKP